MLVGFRDTFRDVEEVTELMNYYKGSLVLYKSDK